MVIEIEEVNLGDGQWWSILKEETYGTSRKVLRLAAPYADGAAPKTPEEQYDLTDEISLVYLVNQSVAWSFPGPVVEEEIMKRRKSHVSAVLNRMKELYLKPEPAQDREVKKN